MIRATRGSSILRMFDSGTHASALEQACPPTRSPTRSPLLSNLARAGSLGGLGGIRTRSCPLVQQLTDSLLPGYQQHHRRCGALHAIARRADSDHRRMPFRCLRQSLLTTTALFLARSGAWAIMQSDAVVQRHAQSLSRVLSRSNANRRRSAGSAMNARRHRRSARGALLYPA
jgi:hypothetical protein